MSTRTYLHCDSCNAERTPIGVKKGGWWQLMRFDENDLAEWHFCTLACLGGAGLGGAYLGGADLRYANYTQTTTWPAKFDAVPAGAVKL